MEPLYLLSLANPVIAGLFFLTFYSIWRRQRERRYILAWSLVYMAASVSWGVEFLRIFFGDMWVSWAANAIFPAVTLFTARGVCLRYRGSSPDRALLLIYGMSVAVSSYFSLVHVDIFWRGTSISSGMAVMLAIGLIAVLRRSPRDHIDLGIAFALGLVATLMVSRSVMSILVENTPTADEAMPASFWVVSMKLIALLSWMTFAILFLMRIALDLMEELAEQSRTDVLSGAFNRRGFFERAVPLMEQASATLPAAVLICDIDHFKKINDVYGHSVGDAVIKGLGKVLREVTGEAGIVGRIGGEEFAVLLPRADMRSAKLFAETIRTAFSHNHYEGLPSSHQPTVSIGIAESQGSKNLDAVLERADAALYRAKRGGRDRVELSVALAACEQKQASRSLLTHLCQFSR